MQVIEKKSLKYVDGYVIQAKTGNVVNDPTLVYQYNELMEMKDFNAFVAENKSKIETVGTKVVYKPAKPQQSITVPEPKTPLAEKKEEEALAFWNEQVGVETAKETNKLLARYDRLTSFVKDSNVLFTGTITVDKFSGDILKLTVDEVVEIVSEYVSIADLRKKVIFE